MTVKKIATISGLIAVIIILFFLMMRGTGWDNSLLAPVTSAVKGGVTSVQKGLAAFSDSVNNFSSYFTNNNKLEVENGELKKRIALLESKLYVLREEDLENDRLNALLGYKEVKAADYELALAKVIAKDSGNWYKAIVINRGSDAGMQKNMVVVTQDGLVGIINSTTANSAEVLLIIDAESAVGAKILENRATPGIASGTGRSDYLKMMHLPHDVPIEKGQTIVSSGLGGLYPEGIRIGIITEVALEPSGLIMNAIIEPAVDFDTLEEVFVITQVQDNPTVMQEE